MRTLDTPLTNLCARVCMCDCMLARPSYVHWPAGREIGAAVPSSRESRIRILMRSYLYSLRL